MTSLATRLAARDMGGNAVYGDLKPGDRFSFPKHPHLTYEKLDGGWYAKVPSADGSSAFLAYPKPKFRTGSGTAVVKS